MCVLRVLILSPVISVEEQDTIVECSRRTLPALTELRESAATACVAQFKISSQPQKAFMDGYIINICRVMQGAVELPGYTGRCHEAENQLDPACW
jgi:hypothetical protein